MMNGWLEWLVFLIGMILAGIGALVFFTFPLFTLLVAGFVGLAWWLTLDPRPSSRSDRPPHQ